MPTAGAGRWQRPLGDVHHQGLTNQLPNRALVPSLHRFSCCFLPISVLNCQQLAVDQAHRPGCLQKGPLIAGRAFPLASSHQSDHAHDTVLV